MKNAERTDRKLTYRKPALREIALQTEEVLGNSCKSESTGPNTGSYPCTLGNCSGLGDS